MLMSKNGGKKTNKTSKPKFRPKIGGLEVWINPPYEWWLLALRWVGIVSLHPNYLKLLTKRMDSQISNTIPQHLPISNWNLCINKRYKYSQMTSWSHCHDFGTTGAPHVQPFLTPLWWYVHSSPVQRQGQRAKASWDSGRVPRSEHSLYPTSTTRSDKWRRDCLTFL